MKAFMSEIRKLFQKPQALLLTGPLGVGKTTFVQTLLEKENSKPQSVSSPAFAIQHYYPAPLNAYHMDLYRLKNDKDLEFTGFWDVFSDTQKLILIEWAERLNKELLPKNWHYLQIRFSFAESPHQRHIEVQNLF